MKFFSIILLLFLSLNVFAQKSGDVLATANGRNYTAADLAPEVRIELENLPKAIGEVRRALLEQQINDILFEREAAARSTTVEKLIEQEIKAKVPAPTEAQIKNIYDANRAAIGTRTIDEVRKQIVEFLRREPEQKAFAEYLSNLKVKYKATLGKDVNAANLSRLDVLATVADKQISVDSFESRNKITLSEYEADAYDHAREYLNQIVFNDLMAAEAKTQNIQTGDIFAREITDKLKAYTPEEQASLETALREKLFTKYKAKITVKEFPPIVQNISTDDDPAQGKATAPVTIVMFTDFQCPACSGTYPILKQVIGEFGDKIRFVERDFPLITIHENALQAAIAAGAANAQGKFFEYTEVLYKNQSALDIASLKKYAADLGLNVKQFETDMANPKIADEIRKDMADGKSYGISGTPTIYVNGVKVRHISAEGFREAIKQALKK